jgi:anti-anti-sigma factor
VFEAVFPPGGCRIRFSASLDLLDLAVGETVAFLRRAGATASLFEIKLLLREALLNAVIHGSRLDAGLPVVLEVMTAEDRLTFSVQDLGPGFDWRSALTRRAPPEATSGRGLTILALYADAVRFNDAGNRATLTKTVPGLRGPAIASAAAGENTTRSEPMPDIRIENGRAVLCPAGDIVASTTVALRQRIKDILAEHPGSLTIDLSRVELVDSVGIGLLIAAHNTLDKTGGQLALTNVKPELAALLRTMRLDKHFSIQAA